MRTGEKLQVLSEFQEKINEEINNRKEELEAQRLSAKTKKDYITMMNFAIQMAQLDFCRMIFDQIYMKEFNNTIDDQLKN